MKKTKTKQKQKHKKATSPDAAPVTAPELGRLGAERWLAVRQKSGAGPMEPKARKLTRAERERRALELESDGKDV